jgi:MoaA/NifB/PqqE/SkfB family radical SAM enzyme
VKVGKTAIGLVASKFAQRPFYVRFHVTHRCDYRCGMCALPRLADRSSELGPEKIRKVAQILAGLGARHAVITGGEPFLRKDLPEIVGAFAGAGFSVRIQTNGGPRLTAERLAACARAGLCDLSVSLDTLDAELQDRICNDQGVVENALRSLDLARLLLPRGMSLANIVASGLNFAELPDLVRHLGGRGIYSYITPVMISPPGDGEEAWRFRSGETAFLPVNVTPATRNRVIDELVALRRQGAGLTNSTRYLEDWRDYLASGECHWRCGAGTLCLDVMPDGGVTVCKEKPPFANVLDEGFRQRVLSRGFRREAAELTAGCTGCFYGEYREPQYAVRSLSVFAEWVRDWTLTFRRGMRFGPPGRREPAPRPAGQSPVVREDPAGEPSASKG